MTGDGVSAARTVADVMTAYLKPIGSEMPLHQACRLLLEQKARALPVVDREGHVVGVLGEEELLVRFGPRRRRPWWRVFASRDQLAQEYRQAVGTTVTDLMTHPVVTASPTLPLATAVSPFDTPSIRVVPVVADGCLVGTVTRGDVLRALTPEAGTPEWRSDGDLVNEMRARMLDEQAWVPIPRPAVSACDGLLVLWGRVESSAQKTALDTMARAMPGCRGVESHLVTAHARTAASRPGLR